MQQHRRFGGAVVALWCVLLMLPAQSKDMALILSGGGSRGLAQIGVIKAFEEHSIQPDLVVGTSMGAVVAGLYAAGLSADSIHTLVKAIDWNDVFSNTAQRNRLFVSQKTESGNHLLELRFGEDLRPMLPRSISYGQKFYNHLVPYLAPAQYHAAGDFDSLPIPLRIVATDIVSGRAFVFSQGNLARAIRASSGIPLAFSPVNQGKMLLMDGGIVANLPVEPAVAGRYRYIVAVDVTSPLWGKTELDNPVRLIDQLVSIGINRRKAGERRQADCIIAPDLAGVTNTDFTGIDTLVERGYRAALAKIPQIAKRAPQRSRPRHSPGRSADANNDLNVQPPVIWVGGESRAKSMGDSLFAEFRQHHEGPMRLRHVDSLLDPIRESYPFCATRPREKNDSRVSVTVNPGLVASVEVAGNTRTRDRLLASASGIDRGDILEEGRLGEAVSSLYSTGLFNTVNADMDTMNRVRITVEEKEYLRTRLGLRFDEFHLGEGFIQPAYENLFGVGVCALLHLQYGLRREKYALELETNQIITPKWANNLRVQIYVSRERIVRDSIEVTDTADILHYEERSLRKAGVLGLVGTQVGRVAMLHVGAKLERFRFSRTEGSVFDEGLGTFREGMRYLMVGLTIDDLDRYPFPRRGQRHFIRIGGASDAIGGTENFLKIDGSMGYYATFGKRHTVIPQTRLAWASSPLPAVEKVYLGGALAEERYREMGVYNHVPFFGLKPRSLPGDVMAVLRLAYRLKLAKNLYFRLAADWGYTWPQEEFLWDEAFFSEWASKAPLGVGAGLAYNTPVGPIRLSWGRLLRAIAPYNKIGGDNLIYFSAGHDF